MIGEIGKLTGTAYKAIPLIDSIKRKFRDYEVYRSQSRQRTACYLIWEKPFMTVGSDTFIHTMLERAGFINVFQNRQRYPETTIEEIQSLHPEVLLLSSEPFPFTKKHRDKLAPLLPGTKVLFADGEMFSWYGSRLLHCCHYFKELTDII